MGVLAASVVASAIGGGVARGAEELASPVPALPLAEAEALALGASPTIARAEALVRAAQWDAVQAGLPPNPTVGYTAAEINSGGQAGQQGLYFSQSVIRGGKLRLDRSVAGHEAQRRREVLAAEQLRVRTDVRAAYVAAYLAQRRARLARRLARVGRRGADTAAQLLEAQEGRGSDLLLAEIEAERAQAEAARAEARLRGAWRSLAGLIGIDQAERRALEFDTDELLRIESFDEALPRLLASSPQIAEAVADVERARCRVARERAEPTPDVAAQASVQYDDAASETLAGVQVGFRLPLWNRNRGGIGAARAELTAAARRLDAVERALRVRLAERYQAYDESRARAVALRDRVLDRAERNLALVAEGYRAGEFGYLDVVTAQRTFFRVNLDYLDALSATAANAVAIEGRLLEGSLDAVAP